MCVVRFHQIGEERETVLTLADKHVLADDAEDVLVNVNLLDDERYKKVPPHFVIFSAARFKRYFDTFF